MPTSSLRGTAAVLLAAGSLLAAPGAFAQSVMPTVSVPPPPSASDRVRPDGSAVEKPAAKSKARTSASGETRRLKTPPASAKAEPGYSDRIDARTSGRGMELEDDPRAVQPVMQNGRPGVGMRF